MRVLVCGGRYYSDVRRLWKVLDKLDAAEPDGAIRLVIEGASEDVTGPYVGADYWAHEWARAHDRPSLRFHADWKKLGRSAGPIRNQRMADEGKPDVAVAFPGGHGTASMVRIARAAGIEVIEVGETGHDGVALRSGREALLAQRPDRDR